MKQTKLILFAAILVSALFWSCKDTTQLTNAIPADAIVVIHVDTKSLLTKADYKPFDNKLIKEAFEKEKNRGSERNKAMTEKMEEFLKDPNSSGIDLIHDCYMYVGSTSMGVIWGMKDVGKFKEVLTKTFDVPEEMIKEEDGISTVDLSSMAKIGWAKDKVLIITASTSAMYGFGNNDGPDLMELLKKQLKQTEKESINANKAFAEFVKDKKDISVFYSYSNIPGLWGNMASRMIGAFNNQFTDVFGKLSDQIKGVNAAGFVSFEKGEIVTESKFYYDSPEAEKRIADLSGKLTQELKGDQIKYLAEKPLFLAAMGINGGGIYDYLTDLGLMQLVEDIAGSNLNEMGIDLKSLISNVDGDITVSINGVKTVMKKSYYSDYEYPSTEPEFSVFADLKDAKPTWDLIKNKVKEVAAKEEMTDSTLVEIDENTYSFKMDEGMKGYAGIKGNTIYITNSEAIYKNISTATDGKNDFASLAKGKTSLIFGSLGSLRTMLEDELQSNAGALELATKGFDLLGDYSFASDKNLNSKGKIVINDNSANSLAVICKYIDSVITYAIEKNL
ncbi:MAG: DUF4836 family protein [Prevotella sp.]|jgi:hypothetical protein|nr:DUF4836 family protein [Prevotella sp.]